MKPVYPLLLLGLAGLLTGGAWSMRQQGASGIAVGVTAALAVLALVGGILWLLPDGATR